MKPLLLLSISLLLLGLPSVAAAIVIFESGTATDFSGTDPTGAIVRDGPGGAPTTVTFLAGADLGPTDIEGASLLYVEPGSTVDDFDVLGASRLFVSGGTHGVVDYLDDSSGEISGGTFTGCFPCLRLFATADAIVTGGTFASPSQIVASTDDFARLEIRAGDFTGFVRANDDSTIDLFGGTFERVQSLDQATLTLHGSGFLAAEGATTVLAGFGEITDGFNGTITGELSDGTPLSVLALNGVVGSRIVLAPGPPPVPALPALGQLLMVLLGIGSGGLALRRATAPAAEGTRETVADQGLTTQAHGRRRRAPA